MSKQEGRDDLEREMEDMRREYDRRLHDLEGRLKKAHAREGRDEDEIEDERMSVRALRARLDDAGARVKTVVKKGDDMVADHPLIVLGGALAIGVVLGALIATRAKTREED